MAGETKSFPRAEFGNELYDRRLKRELNRAQATGTASKFLRDDAKKREAVSQAIDSTGKNHSVLNIPKVGIFDMETGKNLAGMMAMGYTDNNKKSPSGGQTISLPTADFDVCENGIPVTYTLYGSKKTTA